MDFLEGHWDDPDNGLWEVRGSRRHFVHSKVMAWAGADRLVHAVERFGLDQLLDLRNEVGLLAEEWDPRLKRQVGNVPQAFSHEPLVNSARLLSGAYVTTRSQRREMHTDGTVAPPRQALA